TALSFQLLLAHLGQRLLGRVLRVSVDPDAGRRRLRLVRRARRPDPRQWRPLPQHGAVARQHRRPRQDVRRLARPRPQHRRDEEGSRVGAAEEVGAAQGRDRLVPVIQRKARFGGLFLFRASTTWRLSADSVEKLDSKIWPTKHRPRERGCGAVLIANYVESNSRGPTFAEN